MEQKKIRRNSLKFRILKNLFVVLLVSMLISTIISFLYFVQIVRNQKIADEEGRVQQVSNQITFMVEDIQGFGRSMIADEDLQELLDDTCQNGEFERLKKRYNISKRLSFYNSLRSYIRSSYIELENGEGYTSSDNMDKDYLKQKTAIAEIQEYGRQSEWFFSNPYYGIDNWDSKPVICNSSSMMDKYQFGKKKGVLTLEISLEYFLKQIKNYGREYENICLVGNDGMILYEENDEKTISRLLESNDKLLEQGIHKVKEGYLICKDVEKSGWKLCTLISNTYLWKSSSYVPKFLFLCFLFSLSAILLNTSRLMECIIKPITYLSEQMGETNYEKLHMQERVQTGDEIQILYECYNTMVGEIQRGIDERIEYEKQKKKMEFDIMLSQINPHYLYNVLNTVVYLSTAGKNEEVVQIVNSMIHTLQETINLGEKNIETTVEKEIELTETYLNIQKYRYPGMFRVSISCSEDLKDVIVPKTIIQPLVENAILHGILPLEKEGTVLICIKKIEKTLCIIISDDGVGISEKRLQLFQTKETFIEQNGNGRKHIGISNVRDRIQYLYGEPYGMWITRRIEGGTQITIHLPFRKIDDEL